MEKHVLLQDKMTLQAISDGLFIADHDDCWSLALEYTLKSASYQICQILDRLAASFYIHFTPLVLSPFIIRRVFSFVVKIDIQR
jgi:hypothetical protein